MTHAGWRNVISLSAVLNFLLPARGRWAPGLRTISSAQSSSSWCRTCLCFHRYIFTCRSICQLRCRGTETIPGTLHMLSIVKRWRLIIFPSPVQHLYLLTLFFFFFFKWHPDYRQLRLLQRAAGHGPLGLTDWTLKRKESQGLQKNELANTNIIQITSYCWWSIHANLLQKCK